MSDDSPNLGNYFVETLPQIWNWQDGDDVLTWSGGLTIAFRPQIEAVLARLAPQGLPSFGSIVLFLAATRNSWSEDGMGQKVRQEFLRRCSHLQKLVDIAFDNLDAIHRLRHLVGTPAATAELAALAFESYQCHRALSDRSATLLQAFRDGLAPWQLRAYQQISEYTGMVLHLAPFNDPAPNLTAETLILRLSTGLDQEVQPAPIEFPAAPVIGAARQLITQLQDDEQLGGLARLARLLLAAVQLPRPLSDPDDLPIGGVTDITNRGPLDRLMLSELAHDDLTLATRVAMNEALYLRREPLARPQSRQRFVLIDSGLRMWGVPRVFAAAVGMAVAAQAGPRLEVFAWRPEGDRVEPIDFRSSQGLANHLGALDHRAHPGAALPRFAGRVAEATASSDVLLVTGDDVLADADFAQALAASSLQQFHVATVNRDGEFRLLHRSRSGTKVLREACFDLEEVLKPRPKAAPLLDQRVEPKLPAICRVRPFPLLLSYPVRVDNSWDFQCAHSWEIVDGKPEEFRSVLTVTKDQRLLYWSRRKQGAQQLMAGLPPGRLHWCHVSDQDPVATLVVGKLSQRGLYAVRYNFATREQWERRLDLPMDQPQQVLGHNGVLLVTYHGQIAAIDPASGRLLDWAKCDRPLVGRMFAQQQSRTGADNWFAWTFNGHKLQVLSVFEHLPNHPPLVGMIEGPEGPVGVTGLGELVSMGDGLRRQLPLPHGWAPCRIAAVSRDRQRLALQSTRDPANLALVELSTGSVSPVCGRSPKDVVELPMLSSVTTRTLRVRFSAIAVDGQSRLTLVSPRGTSWPLIYDAQRRALVFPKQPASGPSLRAVSRFAAPDFTHDLGFWLAEACWPDGSRAVLDGRGLLHLQSSRRSVPECSIVLAEGDTAGWTSAGQRFGPTYFTGEPQELPATAIQTEILQPFIEQIT